MKHLFAICALGVMISSCGTPDTTNTSESTDSTAVITTLADSCADSMSYQTTTTVTVPGPTPTDSIQ